MSVPEREHERFQGDPDQVARAAKRYQDIAAAIERSLGTLQEIGTQGSQTSKALDELRSVATEVKDSITNAAERYRVTGDALARYAPRLREAVRAGDAAADAIELRAQELWSRQAGVLEAYRDLQTARSQHADDRDAIDDALRDARAADRSRGDAQAELEAAYNDWIAARDAKDRAGLDAAGEIGDFLESKKNTLTDSFWETAGHFISKGIEILKVVCDVAGILAIFLSWVPVLGPILVGLAALGALLTIIDTSVKFAKGEASGWDLAGAIVGGALTMFGGKLLSLGAKAVRARAVTTMVSKVGHTAAATKLNIPVSELRAITGASRPGVMARIGKTLASPFVRSEGQRTIAKQYAMDRVWGVGRGTAARTAVVSELKNAFPGNPLKDGAMRWAFQNGDVTKLSKLWAEHGDLFTGAMHTQVALLQIGAHANATRTLLQAGASAIGDLQSGEIGSGVHTLADIGLRPADGSAKSVADIPQVVIDVVDLPNKVDEMF